MLDCHYICMCYKLYIVERECGKTKAANSRSGTAERYSEVNNDKMTYITISFLCVFIQC